MSYVLKCMGVQKKFTSLSIQSGLHNLASFVAILPNIDTTISQLQEVNIYRDDELVFLGVVESRRPSFNDQGATLTLEGRDYGSWLIHFTLSSVIFPKTDPSDMIRALIKPTKEVFTYFDDFAGETFNFTPNRGTWAQQNGIAEALDNQADKFMYATCDEAGAANWTNYLVSVYACPLAKYNGNRLDWSYIAVGVVGGFTSGPNYIVAYLGWDLSTGTRKFFLSKVVAGTETVLASLDFDWDYLKTYHIALQLQGTTANAFLDGAQRLTGTIPSGYNTGKPGMIAGGSHCQFDNFFVSLTGKTATASLNSATAINAIDGNLDSKWSSGLAQANGQWFKLDLGAIISDVCRVTVIQDITNFAKNWKIEVSTDDQDYAQVASKTSDYRPTLEAFFAAQSVRYIKITITNSDSAQWDIYEFGVSLKDGDWILAEGTIDSLGDVVTIKLSGGTRLDGCFRVAETIGWNFWIDLEGKVNFKAVRGSDKSNTIKFRKGIEITDRIENPQELYLGNCITVLGSGEGDDQLRVTVKDQDSINEYGQFDKVFIEQDLMTLDALNRRANALLTNWKKPVDQVELDAIDPYASNAFDVGDQVQIVHEDLNLNTKYRIHEIDRTYVAPQPGEGEQGGESIMLILADIDRLSIPLQEPSQIIDEVKIQVDAIRNYPAALDFRFDVEEISGLRSVGSSLPDRYL